MITYLWEYKVQILPVMIGLTVFLLPSYIRKVTGFYYSPVYFSIPPFISLNFLLDRFFYEDSIEKERKIKNEIYLKAVISTTIDAILLPLFAGILCAFIMNEEVFYQYIFILVIILIFRTAKSCYNYSREYYSNRKLLSLLILVYIIYILIVYDLTSYAFLWAYKFVIVKDYLGLFQNLKQLIFYKLFLSILLINFLVTLFMQQLTTLFRIKSNYIYHITNPRNDSNDTTDF